jgi:addiction module RelE/StbE family toxin
MQIIYSKRFDKSFAKLEKKKQQKVMEAIALFQKKPTDISLKNHKLSGNKKGLRAFSAGGDLRVVFLEEGNYVQVLMINVGSHNQVY